MGRVVAPYAVRGWIKLQTFTEYLDSLLDYPVWRLGKDGRWRDYRVLDGKIHGQYLMAGLEGVEDRSAAEALMGLDVAVLREEMPEAEEDEYYWDDLVGLDVVNLQGERLGRVASLDSNGAHDVMALDDGKRMLPWIPQVVRKVDLDARRIEVDWGTDW